MDTGALSLALGAGLLAAVNPCGFALLPAYLGMLVADGPGDTVAAVGRALRLTAAMTLGFAAVFLLFGLVVVPAAASVQEYLPWVTLTFGVLVAMAGVWLLSGRSLPVPRWRPRGFGPSGSTLGMVGFGASYALASVTCTIAPFLAVVASSLRSGSTVEGLALFVTYAAGMGLVVGVVAVAAALANASVVRGLRRTGRWVPTVAGLLLTVSGTYVAYYGWWELRVLDGAAADDPVIDGAQRLRSYAVDAITSLGALRLAIGLAVLVVIAVAAHRLARRRTPQRSSS
ncbi:MAG: cytochrome c biogenesis protein CcdA [Nocardioides sp.]